jgi:MazG family protein
VLLDEFGHGHKRCDALVNWMGVPYSDAFDRKAEAPVAKRGSGKKMTHGRSRAVRKKPQTPRPAARLAETPRQRTPGEWFEALVAVQKRLLGPGGCPWDREQTHDTLRPYLIEEAYEVLDALDKGDPSHIAEELGDLLLQVVFHAQLGAQAGRFDISDVIEYIHDKLVRRHPHVFGEVKAETSAQVLKNWDVLKAEEKRVAQSRRAGKPSGEEASGQADAPASALDGVPRTLPALIEGYQLSKKASKVGFDWKTAPDILDKLTEEVAELRQVLSPGKGDTGNGPGKGEAGKSPGKRDAEKRPHHPPVDLRERQQDEFGDLLFSCVNLGRFLGLDAEIALKKANLKFARRFREMESLATLRGLQLERLSSDDLESLWEEAKVR